jgi:hypothetical protein
MLALTSCATLGDSAPAAQLERFDIVSRTPAFGGASFDDAGQYETIVGIAHMRINPRHRANRIIADLDLAPAPDGWVRYQSAVTILRPRAPAGASRVLVVELPNRGGRLFHTMINEGRGELDAAAAAGTGFTMRRGHTLAWIGWQGDIGLDASGKLAGVDFPLATGAGGAALTGASVEEVVFDDIKPESTIRLGYPAATLDQGRATLTVRARAGAPPTVLAPSLWHYNSATEIGLMRPRGFDAGALYQFRYEARDARVMGLGLAALRDVTRFLKSGAPDAAGQPNPLADIRPEIALAVGVSQSGRVLRDLIWQGFNADPSGGRVFDGAMPLLAGSRKSFVNARFAQPGLYSTQHLDHLSFGDQFPFSYGVTTDPVSGKTDGIFARCQANNSCPKLIHVDSSTEFWQARASLVVTDGAGHDIALPDGVRAYLLASTQHMTANSPSIGVCKYQNNPARQGPAVRALLDQLVAWTRDARLPPASRYPRLADAMLTTPQREAVGFPDLGMLGIGYPAALNELSVVDYSVVPPRPDPARRYQVLLPMADQDGHDIAGIRLPDVAVPLATHAGWNLRRAGFAENALCGLNGLYLPFPARARAGDPRSAIDQRYRTRLDYAKAVALAARALRDDGLLLEEDVGRYIERAKVESRVQP